MKKRRIVAGIDYSLSCPALCIHDANTKFTFENCRFFYLTNTKKHVTDKYPNILGDLHDEYFCTEMRFNNISDRMITNLRGAGVTEVYLEGYSMGSRGRVFHIGEATGLLKHHLWISGFPFTTIPPTTIKKSATGKGSADKDSMFASFLEFGGPNLWESILPDKTKIDSPVTDLVDAFWICKYGEENGNK